MRPTVLALSLFAVTGGPATGQDVDPKVAELVGSVSEQRLRDDLTRLVGFGTRHTLSKADDPVRGIGAARQWLLEAFQGASDRLQVSFDSYTIPAQGQRITREVELRNVVAVLPGRSPRRIYVSGHYDSLARLPDGSFDWSRVDHDAPGANDDGSGTVLTLELARVLARSGLEFDATLVFVAFAGEEEGLVGALLHAQRAEAEQLRIDAVLNNDIVGNSTGGDGVSDTAALRVFSAGPEDSPSRQIARFVRRQAARYVPGHEVRLVARHDRFGRGGDHTALNQHGFPGVRLSEARENYVRQHTQQDTLEGVDFAYLARNARVNVAAAAVLALAPQAPVVEGERGRPLLGRGPSGYDAQLTWRASPGAVGYRVFWRQAWSGDWEHELAVGDVSELVLPGISIDGSVFGVAAVGPQGHESLVAAYVNPPRAEVEIQTR